MKAIVKIILVLVIPVALVNCNFKKQVKLSKVEAHFDQILKEKLTDDFEEDSEFGYIKIGYLLNPQTRNAIVVSFDSITSFKVYELRDREWVTVYKQDNVGFTRINDIVPYIADYNFDGIKDIGIRNEVSNGTAIMTFRLWLSKGKTWQYVPEFETIGNPRIVTKNKTIQGFKACCVFTEMELKTYQWQNDKLLPTHTLTIENYAYGLKAIAKNESKPSESKIKFTANDVAQMIKEYSENWTLVDTAAGFTR